MEIDVIDKLREAFPDLDADALGELSGLVRIKTYPPDILVCKEGAFEDVFYLIIEGEVAITKHLEGDEQRVLRHSVAGDFFGEMALIQDEPRSANVRTVKETTVLEFDREVFEHLMASSPNLAWRCGPTIRRHWRTCARRTRPWPGWTRPSWTSSRSRLTNYARRLPSFKATRMFCEITRRSRPIRYCPKSCRGLCGAPAACTRS